MAKRNKKKTQLHIYPTHSSFGGSSGRSYDARLVQWADFEKRIKELEGKQRLDFLESMFTYPLIPRVRSSKPYEYTLYNRISSDDERLKLDEERGYEHIEDYVVQNESNFKEKVFHYIRELSAELIYPMFVESFSRTDHRPYRFNLSMIADYGDNFLFGDFAQQILFYSFLISSLESIPDSNDLYNEEEDFLFMFNKKVRRDENAVAQVVLRFARSRVAFYREVQYQDLLTGKKPTQQPIVRKSRITANDRKIETIIESSTPLEIFRGVHWESTEAAKNELLEFLEPKYGKINDDLFYIYDSKKEIKNLYFILMTLHRNGLFGSGVHDEDIVNSILIEVDQGKPESCTVDAYRSGKSRLTGVKATEKPHPAVEKFMNDFIIKYGKSQKNDE